MHNIPHGIRAHSRSTTLLAQRLRSACDRCAVLQSSLKECRNFNFPDLDDSERIQGEEVICRKESREESWMGGEVDYLEGSGERR
jgi:hypothetical protein